jgi:hypothetical protein
MSSIFRPQQSFLQNTAWQHQAKNALHYNTSQQGSVIPLIYGTCRQQVNLIDLKNYKGPKGKKGKTGSLPLSGTSQSGKGGGSSKGKGGKKNGHYSVFVDFALCQGPVGGTTANLVFSSAGVASFGSTGLHAYLGYDGQTPDPSFNSLGYSGTVHVTGTPMDLGQSPVLPNVGIEITGMMTGVNVGAYTADANPGDIITDFLTNVRYGAGFPPECLDRLTHDPDGVILNTYGDYCQAASLLVSSSLDGHQKAIEWLNGLIILTNSTMVWSGRLLKVVPYGDLELNNNGAYWYPFTFTYQYDLTDDDFLPWNPHQEGGIPTPGDDDPIMLMRSNPADADNWISMEYMDRKNFYNSTIITAYDQGAIDTYGLRIGDSLPGRAFCNQYSAQISIQLLMQRRMYIRNNQIKFQLGWQYCLLEPMDMVTLTGHAGDTYLDHYPVRILTIEENDNGDLIFTCEDPQMGGAAPVSTPPPLAALTFTGQSAYIWQDPQLQDSSQGTLSLWVNMDQEIPKGETCDLITAIDSNGHIQLKVFIDENLSLSVILDGEFYFQTDQDIILTNSTWQHLLLTWTLDGFQRIILWVDGHDVDSVMGSGLVLPPMLKFSLVKDVVFYSGFRGDTSNFWWTTKRAINSPSIFRNTNSIPRDPNESAFRHLADLDLRFPKGKLLSSGPELILDGPEPLQTTKVLY